MTDEERMRLTQSGDMVAFEALVEAWYDRALRYTQAIISHRETAEDAVQDCFAALYVKRHQYRPEMAFDKYFKALLRFRCIDILRQRRRSPALLALEDELATDDTPENALVQRWRQETVLSAIMLLPEAQQQLLIAFAVEGKSYQALADQFCLSVPQVKIRLHRMRKLLKHAREEWQ